MSATLQPSLSSAVDLDAGADQAIAACGGDPRKAVKALLVANGFLEAQFEELRSKVSQATREDDFRQRAIVRSS